MVARGIVIKESLIRGRLPDQCAKGEIRRYPQALDGIGSVEIIEFGIDQSFLAACAFALSEQLQSSGYYCHFVMNDRMVVVFPKSICCVMRGSISDAERARRIGALFAIPIEQMQFERMFMTDHPDAERGP